MPMAEPIVFSETGITGSGARGASGVAGQAAKDFAIQVVRTAGASGFTVTLEGSLDNSNWTTLGTHSGTSGEVTLVTNKPVTYWRANVTTVGAGNTLSVHVLPTG